jgi:antitoxin component YwqK of YwqJK toxin-antitoxin module
MGQDGKLEVLDMKNVDRKFIQECLDREKTDIRLIIQNDGCFYEEGSDTPFSGVQTVFFPKMFWQKKYKVKRLEYFEDGKLMRSVRYYRNGQIAVDHVTGKYPKKFYRNGTPDTRPDVNHR